LIEKHIDGVLQHNTSMGREEIWQQIARTRLVSSLILRI
jgi:hypothetical protein